MKLLILLLIITPQMIYTACSDGCLKCGKGSKCLICDLSNFYVNKAGTCVVQSAENCHLLSNDGQCLRCNRNFYLDDATKKCVQINPEFKLPNCDFQISPKQCALCNKYFYLDEQAECQPVEIYVPGCKIHSQQHCLVCDDNKVLHPSRERCIDNPGTEQCASYGYLKCTQCESGYVMNLNPFFETKEEERYSNIQVMLRDINRKEIDTQDIMLTPCQKLLDPNCREFENFQACEVCKEFFYLDENKVCQRYPIPSIRNCEIYGNYNICIQCKQGYLLSSPAQCVPVKKIDFCAIYDNTTAINLCLECQPDYFVQGNQCMKRLIKVDHCATYQKKADSCKTCEAAFVLTDDRLKCLPEIANCGVYELSTEQNSNLTCKVCKTQNYATNNTCVAGTIANCLVYASQTVCSICDNGYLWGTDANNSAPTCVPHKKIEYCDIYSQLVIHQCDICDNEHLLLVPTNSCEQITQKVPQCIKYLSLTECGQCKDGYYLQSAVLCTPIPEQENCLRKNGGLEPCTFCKNGYVLNDGKCQKPLDFQIELCQKWNLTTTNEEIQCNWCKPNSIFIKGGKNFAHCITPVERSTYFTKGNITNCEHYVIDKIGTQNSPTCAKCKEGYYISEDKLSCVDNCPNQLLFDLKWDNRDRKVNRGRCVNIANQQNCLIVSPILSNNSVDENNVACIECKPGFIKVQSQIDFVGVNPDDQEELYKFGIYYHGFSCAALQTDVYHSTNSSSPPLNCSVFEKNPNTQKYECRRCDRGWTGPTDLTSSTNLLCTKEIFDCDNDIYHGGFFEYSRVELKNLQNYLTCHQCYTRGKIPFLFLNDDYKLKDYGIEFGDQSFDQSVKKGSTVLQCFEPSALHFKVPEDRYSSQFPENCGVGMVLVDKQKDYRFFYREADWSESIIQCLHCKPGFRPSYQDGYITKCEKIENCSNNGDGQWFDRCSECNYGFSWMARWNNANQNYDIDYDRCVPNNNDAHCLAYSQIKENQTNCILCENEYKLNKDGICEKIQAPLCQENASFYEQKWYTKNNVTHHPFYHYFVFYSGCDICNDGYHQMSVLDKDYSVCYYSPYDYIENFIQDSNYIQNCKNYRAVDVGAGRFECEICEAEYILSTDNKHCIPQTSYPNCGVADLSTKKCNQCNEWYVNVDGFCEKPIIKYCKQYAVGLSYQKCQLCQDQYKLIDNHCLWGHVQFCQTYNNGDCQMCLPEYHLINIWNGQQYCVKKLTDQNCTSSSINNLTREWTCLSCNHEFVPTVDPTKREKSICQQINLIEECKTYHNKLAFLDSQYTCLECNEGFYLSKNQCFKRKNLTPNCKRFSMTLDYCVECESSFYLNNDKQCDAFPTGIPHCQIYKDKSTCLQCFKDFYLSSNQCEPQTKENKIPNCEFYSDIFTCSKCERGYYMTNNRCVIANAKNCATYLNLNRCLTCLPNHGFYKDHETGIVHCIFVSTQNCQIAQNQFPFDCIKCNKLYYLDKGKCFANQSFIPQCEEYASADTCDRCEDDYILSHNKKRCLSEEEFGFKTFDNCRNNQETLQPICQLCNVGFQLYKGNCVACREHTPSKGCFQCFGVDQENEICTICMPGWYMDINGVCVKNNAPPTQPQTTPTPTPTPTPDETVDQQPEETDVNNDTNNNTNLPTGEGTTDITQVDNTDANNTNQTQDANTNTDTNTP